MWIARRSKKKPTYPGKLDNTVNDVNGVSQFYTALAHLDTHLNV